jgi:pantoate--beta-alanine ligase
MEIIKDVAHLQKALKQHRSGYGFVPTMGALHEGHLSLVKAALKKSPIVVVSIFVNPTQFNEQSDLDNYPRTLEKDAKLLESVGVKYIFAPGVNVVYPKDVDTTVNIDLGKLDDVMEGEFREGHFTGVMQVVNRLLEIIKPSWIFMGQKDFQQFSIIAHMLKILKSKVELVVVPIKREPHGLAMSSRNERLSKATRLEAGAINKVLKSIKRRRNSRTIEQLTTYANKKLNQGALKLEYITFADGYTLQPINSITDSNYAVCCIAVWADDIRLIDNIILKK